VIAGGVIVAAAIGVGALLLLGGDDGGGAADATDPADPAAQTIDESTQETGGGPIVVDNGDGGDGGDVDAPTTTAAAVEATDPETTAPRTTDAGRPCTSATGRCVFITDIALDGDNVVARYETTGYEAHQNAGPESRHVHFYFDTVPVTQAGIPADSANWVAWGLEEGGGEPVYTFPVSDIPAGATQLCASVANVNHGLDDLNFQCVPLPQT
jgi:hypothetical protein